MMTRDECDVMLALARRGLAAIAADATLDTLDQATAVMRKFAADCQSRFAQPKEPADAPSAGDPA